MTGRDSAGELLRRWREGDAAALDELVGRNLGWMRDYVHRRLGERLRQKAETQDLVQESMVDVLAYGPRFEAEDETQFRGLLARIVENNIRDQNDWWRRGRRDLGRDAGDRTALRLGVPDGGTSPSCAADRAESRDWVRLAMELLAPEDRDVIWLREWQRLPFEEVGQRLGVSANTARMRFQRALPRLAAKVAYLRGGVGAAAD